MRRKLVAGNWKMNGSVIMANELIAALATGQKPARVQIALMPPFPYLPLVVKATAGEEFTIGGQDCSANDSGAFTGEVSARMLADIGCSQVIVGHSERRQLHGETDELIAKKFLAAQSAGLTPILCVGESLFERERGNTLAVVSQQLNAIITAAGIFAFKNAVLAYEPVWAIGTGHTASPAQAQEIHAELRSQIQGLDAKVGSSIRIIYGGSVKGSNADKLFAEPDIDGALVGGASLLAEEFLGIVRAAA